MMCESSAENRRRRIFANDRTGVSLMLDEAVAGSSSYTQPGISGNTAPQMDERLTAALHFINTHYNESPLLLKAVSKSAGLSIWHFSRLFNAHIGMGFRKYLKNIRI